MTKTAAPRSINADSRPDFRHVFRVRFAECDPQGIVFNSRYLEYADMLITEHWREIGLAFAGKAALEFNVVRAEVDFRAPVRVDELLEGRVWVDRLGSSSLTTTIELHGAAVAGTDRADWRAAIMLVHVHVDLASGKSRPIPDEARVRLIG